MKNLTFNIEEEVLLLQRYDLTPSELFVLKLILLVQDDENTATVLQKYLSIDSCKQSFRDILISLQNKGLILKSYTIPTTGSKFVVDDVEINKLAIKNIYKCSFELGKELFDHYPQFANINGCSVPIRSISKKFDSLEDSYQAYGKAIKWNPEAHEEVIKLVDWGKENNIINKTLANFICDHSWIDLQSLQSGDNVNINYNTVRML